MKKLLLAAVLSTIFAAAAIAEDNRDQAMGKHDMGPSPDSSMYKPDSATRTQGMASGKSGTSGTTKRPKSLDR